MRRAHVENLLHSGLSVAADDPETAYRCITDVINNACSSFDNKLEYLISFAKVLANPFFSYRPSVATATIKFLKELINCIYVCSKKFRKKVNAPEFVWSKTRITIKIDPEDGKINDCKNLISLLLVCVSGLASLNSTYLLQVRANREETIKTNLDTILDIFNNLREYLFEQDKDKVKDIFHYSLRNGSDSGENIKTSFAEYIIFSVFRILRATPYGEYRLELFNDIVKKRLCREYKNQKGDDQIRYFYTLLYLECGKSNTDENFIENCSSGIDNLYDQITKDLEPKVVKQTGGVGQLISSCLPYIRRKKNNDYVLIPLTEKGYKEALTDGYELAYSEGKRRSKNDFCQRFLPVISCYDEMTKQLDGAVRLVPEAWNALNQYGVSLNAKSLSQRKTKEEKDKYIFLKILNYQIGNGEQTVPSNENGEQTTQNALYLRFDTKALCEYGKTLCINSMSNGNNPNEDYITMLAALREVLLLRNHILNKMQNILRSDSLNHYVAQREISRALSISKAAQHGNSRIEVFASNETRITGQQGFLGDQLIAKLVANRALSAVYRKESEWFIEESGLDFKLKYPKISLAGYYDKRKLEQNYLWGKIILSPYISPIDPLENSRIIRGKHQEDSYSSAADSFLQIEHSSNDHWESMQYCKVNAPYELTAEDNMLTHTIWLLAYNVLRHSEVYAVEAAGVPPIEKCKKIYLYHEEIEGKNFLVFESIVGSELNAQESCKKAREAMLIPPWVRGNGSSITLWTLARYYKRGWSQYQNEAVDSTDVMRVESGTLTNKGKKYPTFKVMIRVTTKVDKNQNKENIDGTN